MDEVRLAAALSGFIGSTLAAELAANFVKIRQDCTTRTLERAVAGKFVETFVQCLQYLETGKYDSRPSVDDYLGKKIENTSFLKGFVSVLPAWPDQCIHFVIRGTLPTKTK